MISMTQPLAAFVVAGTCLVAAPAWADATAPCKGDPSAVGMRMRMEQMHDQIDKAQSLSDRADQRRVLELHAKHMREGARELRRRESLQPACRIELMHALLEQMIAHQQATQELGER
jgi:hypothetical protein